MTFWDYLDNLKSPQLNAKSLFKAFYILLVTKLKSWLFFVCAEADQNHFWGKVKDYINNMARSLRFFCCCSFVFWRVCFCCSTTLYRYHKSLVAQKTRVLILQIAKIQLVSIGSLRSGLLSNPILGLHFLLCSLLLHPMHKRLEVYPPKWKKIIF